MLIRCGRPVRVAWLLPPPVEVQETEGLYVLVDDGPPERWWYQFVPREL
jgi:hypothetical protein